VGASANVAAIDFVAENRNPSANSNKRVPLEGNLVPEDKVKPES
jgi:hypothetical protein